MNYDDYKLATPETSGVELNPETCTCPMCDQKVHFGDTFNVRGYIICDECYDDFRIAWLDEKTQVEVIEDQIFEMNQ